MRKYLLILFCFLSLSASATNYYVKNGGNDALAGTSDANAWETVTKVNAVWNAGTFAPDDTIFFNRGDTWSGVTLTVKESGTSGHPIVVSAYGTGINPILTGFQNITLWNNEGGGIYSTKFYPESALNLVVVDGINTGMGRYPDSGYLSYESYNTNISITDNQLLSTPDWTGAEVVIRKSRWILERKSITDHKTTIIEYGGGGSNGINNYGYFIQNGIKTLSDLGEWYYLNNELSMYFGTINPDNKIVKVAAINYLVEIINKNYITFENITFEGANIDTFTIESAQNIIIQNCAINFSGGSGIRTTTASSNASLIVDSNIISNVHQCAIYLKGSNNYGWIKNNTILNIGIIPGAGQNDDNLADGIYVTANNCLVEYNYLKNIGHSGIRFHGGNNIIIRFNLVDNFGLTRYDAGGIYTVNMSSSIIPNGQKILNNIIINSKQTKEGLDSTVKYSLWGIFLDMRSINVEVQGNTVSNCYTAGIINLNSSDIKIANNTFYNNGYQMEFSYMWESTNPIRNCIISDNKLISKSIEQFVFHFESQANDIPQFGIAGNNFYARPIDDNDVFVTNQPSTGTKYRTLEGWQSFTGQDLNSHKSPIAVTDVNTILFEYNATKTDKTITLSKPMIDVTGKKYTGSVTLAPYTSIILMVDPDPDPRIITSGGNLVTSGGLPVKIE